MDLKYDLSFETKPTDSYRSKILINSYDLSSQGITQKFKGTLNLPDSWSVGVIFGNSGSGKTSIAKACFGDFNKNIWNESAIIDNFDSKFSMDEITYALGSVGFNSIPYWLKPYKVLSNGEKSRADLARLLLENDLSIYDEFSSMVDRDVAKSMSFSLQKAVRKLNKKIILISCHSDIVQWLNPDWCLNTDENVFFCQKENEKSNLNFQSQNAQSNNGTFIKNIII